MYAHGEAVTVTTDGSGDATAYTSRIYNGRVLQIRYVKVDYSNGVDFDVTAETSGAVIWDQDNVNASVTLCPRQATTDTAGAASLYAAGGEPVETDIWVRDERIKFVVASGGAAHSGVFHVVVG
jgi:hypothetical protein